MLNKEKFYSADADHSFVALANNAQLGSCCLGEQADVANSDYDASRPDIVTLTLGADDVDFGTWLGKCYALAFLSGSPAPPACGTSGDDADLSTLLSSAEDNLHKVLQEIQDRGQADGKMPHVLVTGLYDPFPDTYDSSCPDIVLPGTFGNAGLTESEMDWLKVKLGAINVNISYEAAQFGATYVSLTNVMGGHTFCSSSPWVYGPSILTQSGQRYSPAPFHPTPDGQDAIKAAIQAKIAGSSTNYALNGTFESGSVLGWNATNTPAVSTSVAHSGSKSMTFTGSFNVTDSPNALTTQASYIDPVDFWAKGPSGKTVRVKFRQYLNGGNNELYQSFTLTGGWDHFVSKALHLYGPDSTLYDPTHPGVDFNIDNPGATSSGVYYLDDIKQMAYTESETCGHNHLLALANDDAVENCGGEAPYGTQNWAAADTANPTLTADDTDAHNGNYSFKLVAANSGTMAMNDSPDTRDLGEVPASDTSCTSTAWVKGPSTAGSRVLKLRIREYNAGTGSLVGTATATATPNGSWQQLTVTRTLGSGHDSNTHLDLNAYMTNAATGDVVRVDHLTSVCS